MREISYEPRNVRETLVELKDSSELAVDLAYSAVRYDDADLADEAVELESRVNYLQYHGRIVLMLAAKRAEEAEGLVRRSISPRRAGYRPASRRSPSR